MTGLSYEKLRDKDYPHCPICLTPMVPGEEGSSDNAMRTKAHVVSRRAKSLVWIYACRACNMEQGRRDMAQWLADLAATNDPRTKRLAKVLAAILKRVK